MAKAEHVSTIQTTTSMSFFGIKRHPKALRFEKTRDDELIAEGVVPRATVKRLLKAGTNLVTFFTTHTVDDKSLRDNAVFWPVKEERLTQAETPHSDLFDTCENSMRHVEDPGYVLIHKSGWDHQVWGIDGKPILIPIQLGLWETRFFLDKVKEHFRSQPAVVSFKIVDNSCRQNWGISGRSLGELVLDVKQLPLAKEFTRAKKLAKGKVTGDPHLGSFLSGGNEPAVTRSWLEDNVINGLFGDEHDYLGLKPFRRKYR